MRDGHGRVSLLNRCAWLKRNATQKTVEVAGLTAVSAELRTATEVTERFNAKVLAGLCPGDLAERRQQPGEGGPHPERQTALARRLRYYTGAGGRDGVRQPQQLSFADAQAPADRPELRTEAARLATFRVGGACADAAEIAAAGFHWVAAASDGGGGVARCAFCRGDLNHRLPGETAMAAHARQFATCPFVLRLDVGNVPAAEDAADAARCRQPVGCSECGQDAWESEAELRARGGRRRLDTAEEAALLTAVGPPAVSAATAAAAAAHGALNNLEALEACAANVPASRPDQAELSDRLRSMSGRLFLMSRPTPPADLLAAAGLFLLAEGGRHSLCCYSCGLRLYDCPAGSNPWLVHAVWSPRCPHLLLERGAAFVRAARDRQRPLPPAAEAAPRRWGESFEALLPPPCSSARLEELGVLHFRLGPREVRARADSPRVRDAQRILGGGGGGGCTGAEVAAVTELRLATAGDDFHCPEGLLAGILDQRAERLLSSATPLEAEEFLAERLRGLRSAWPAEPPPLLEDEAAWRVCKVCMDQRVNVLLVDCGHLCCCSRCCRSLAACPICRAGIRAETPVKLA